MSETSAASAVSSQAPSSSPSAPASSGAAGAETGSLPADAAKLAAPEDYLEIDGERLTRAQISEVIKRRKDMDRGAYAAMQKAAEFEKRERYIQHMIDTNPEALFEARGKKFDDVAQRYLSKKLEEASLSPEEIDRRNFQRDKAEFEKQRAALEKQQGEEKETRETAAWTQRYNEQLAAVMDQRDLPRTPETVARMARKVMAYWEQGIEVPFDQVASDVEEDIAADHTHQFKPILADGEKLAKRLGPDGVEAIRKYLLTQARKAQPRPVSVSKQPPRESERASNPNGYVSWDEYRGTKESRRT